MANALALTLIIPKDSDVRFDQGALGVISAQRDENGDLRLLIDADCLERLAPHPIDRPPRPKWLERFFPNG